MKKALALFGMILFLFACSKKEEGMQIPLADEYITWDFRGGQGMIISPRDTLATVRIGTQTELGGMTPDGRNYFMVLFNGDRQPGTYNTANFNFKLDTITYRLGNAPMQVFISRYEGVGGYVQGNYSATLKDRDSLDYPIRGAFRIRSR